MKTPCRRQPGDVYSTLPRREWFENAAGRVGVVRGNPLGRDAIGLSGHITPVPANGRICCRNNQGEMFCGDVR